MIGKSFQDLLDSVSSMAGGRDWRVTGKVSAAELWPGIRFLYRRLVGKVADDRGEVTFAS